jgi:hypothetical protein
MRIQDVAKAYIADGWAVVPLVQGAKKADTKWPRRTYTDADFQDDSNIAVKLGDPSGGLVDVDCDCPMSVAAAKLLLPNTGRVFGRTSKPESHYLFYCKGLKTTQFTDGSKMLVEIRSTGGYTMFPPSVHPSGEPVTWNAERDVMTIDAETLHAVVREVALAALIAEHWGELDHAAMGHLTGFWLQAGLDAATVKRLLKVVCSLCDKSTEGEVLKMAESTIAKHAAGERVTGGPKLKDALGDKLVTRMRSWLRVADVDAIDEMNEKHFWVRMGKDDVVGREDDDYPVFQRPKALYTEYANRQVVVGVDDKGKPQLKPLFPAWLESPNRRSYRKIVFSPPPVTHEAEDYNLWRGYAVAPVPGRWDKFREHLLHIICSGNVEHFHYLLYLLAYTIQFPGERSQVAVVMRGEIGAGKGTLIRMLEDIFGHHFIQLDKVDQLVGRFNAAISGKVIVFADEAFWAGDKREVGALKRLITEPTLAIEFKNIDIVSQRNCVHLFMATNEDWSVPAGLRERRFFAVEVSSARMQDHAYFNAIYDEMRNGGVAAFLYDMLHVPVTADIIRKVPMTSELRAQQNLSLPLELRWWHECLCEAKFGQLVWCDWVPCATIYDAYKTWAREHTNRFLDKIAFGHRMSKFFSAEKARAKRLNGDIERCWRIHELDVARALFDKALGTTTEWPDAGLPVSQGNVPF